MPCNEDTSVLINYYLENSSIGKHSDQTKGLKPGSDVYSISFSQHRGIGEIGQIQFDEYGTIMIRNRSMFKWNPFAHAEAKIKHWTKALKRFEGVNRINITVRQLK